MSLRRKVLEKLRKMSVRELGPFANFILLLLSFLIGRNALNLCSSPSLGRVCKRLDTTLLKFLLNIKKITWQLNAPKELFKIIIHLDGSPGIIRIYYILLGIKV